MSTALKAEALAALPAEVQNEYLRDLIAEAGVKNHVRVILHRARVQGKKIGYDSGELVQDSRVDGGMQACPADFALLDSVRAMHGLKPMWYDEAVRRVGSELRSITPNLRTNVGIDYVPAQLGGTQVAEALYIALTNNTNAANAANTATNTTSTMITWGTASATDAAASTTRGEYTALGVARALGAYAHTTASASTFYTVTKQFTASGTCTSLQGVGLLNNASQNAGTLFLENVFTPTSLATSDQLTIAWTVND